VARTGRIKQLRPEEETARRIIAAHPEVRSSRNAATSVRSSMLTAWRDRGTRCPRHHKRGRRRRRRLRHPYARGGIYRIKRLLFPNSPANVVGTAVLSHDKVACPFLYYIWYFVRFHVRAAALNPRVRGSSPWRHTVDQGSDLARRPRSDVPDQSFIHVHCGPMCALCVIYSRRHQTAPPDTGRH
jgi:hypothetical protein